MDDFKAATRAFFNNEKFSDLTIFCGTTGKEYKAHRLLASSHSQWFMRCCNGAFAESQSRRVELKNDQPEALHRMIEYFYKFDYDDEHESNETISSKLELNAWMLVISDKYEATGLCKAALGKFKREVKNNIDEPKLLIAAASIIYNNLPYAFAKSATGDQGQESPHQLLTDTWIERANRRVEGENIEQLMQSLATVPAFAVHIQMTMLAKLKEEKFEDCNKCKLLSVRNSVTDHSINRRSRALLHNQARLFQKFN